MNAVDALTLPHGRIADARAWSRARRCAWIFDRPLIRDTPANIQRHMSYSSRHLFTHTGHKAVHR